MILERHIKIMGIIKEGVNNIIERIVNDPIDTVYYYEEITKVMVYLKR
jgi:hypothetical protein